MTNGHCAAGRIPARTPSSEPIRHREATRGCVPAPGGVFTVPVADVPCSLMKGAAGGSGRWGRTEYPSVAGGWSRCRWSRVTPYVRPDHPRSFRDQHLSSCPARPVRQDRSRAGSRSIVRPARTPIRTRCRPRTSTAPGSSERGRPGVSRSVSGPLRDDTSFSATRRKPRPAGPRGSIGT